jgi:sodium pump decarboxylase gamma subunit
MLACVLSMTACNSTISTQQAKESAKEQQLKDKKQDLINWSKDMVTYLDKTADDQIQKDAESAKTLDMINNKSYLVNPDGMNDKTVEFYNGWVKSREDLGKLKKINDADCEISNKTSEFCTIKLTAEYEKRACTFEFVINKNIDVESVAINPTFTTGERMEKAGLNTLLGMGTVFLVLIFISFIISLLRHVNKVGTKDLNTSKEKKETKKDTQNQGVDNAIAQIVSNEQNAMEDLELVAVITAAIAAMEGTSADGLVVRSIKRVNYRNNWRR